MNVWTAVVHLCVCPELSSVPDAASAHEPSLSGTTYVLDLCVWRIMTRYCYSLVSLQFMSILTLLGSGNC